MKNQVFAVALSTLLVSSSGFAAEVNLGSVVALKRTTKVELPVCKRLWRISNSVGSCEVIAHRSTEGALLVSSAVVRERFDSFRDGTNGRIWIEATPSGYRISAASRSGASTPSFESAEDAISRLVADLPDREVRAIVHEVAQEVREF